MGKGAAGCIGDGVGTAAEPSRLEVWVNVKPPSPIALGVERFAR